MPELYPPVLLKRRAKRLRKETGDDRYWHPHEREKINLGNIVTKYLSRPLRMLITEPMITCIAIYASFVYGLLYMTLPMFDIVYHEERNWTLVLSSLPFLGAYTDGCNASSLVLRISNPTRDRTRHLGSEIPSTSLRHLLTLLYLVCRPHGRRNCRYVYQLGKSARVYPGSGAKQGKSCSGGSSSTDVCWRLALCPWIILVSKFRKVFILVQNSI